MTFTVNDLVHTHERSLSSECALSAVLYAALTIVLAYPLSVHPATTALPMGADTNLLLWLLQWDLHGLARDPLTVFDANIYYPYRHTLAYAENLLGSAMLGAPVLWTTGNAILALNTVALLSCVLCGAGTFLLARRIGISTRGALLAGIIFAFAPPRFFRLGQLHLATIQWIPFCLAFVHSYFDSGRRRDAWWACGFFALQALTSGHGAVFAAIAVAALVAWRFACGEPFDLRQRVRALLIPVGLMVLVAVAVFLPYRAVQTEMGLRRSLGESYLFSPNAASFLASPTHLHSYLLSRLTNLVAVQDPKAFLFPGYTTLLLALVGLISSLVPRQSCTDVRRPSALAARLLEVAIVITAFAASVLTASGGFRLRLGSLVLSARQPWRAWVLCAMLVGARVVLGKQVPLLLADRLRMWPQTFQRWRQRTRRNAVLFYAVLAAVSFWLSLGPVYVLYRLVYDWPGFSFIRVPSRFTLLTLLGLAVLAGAGFDAIVARLSRTGRRAAVAIAAAALVAEFYAAPLNAIPYAVNIPSADRWLATQPKPFVVAEVPLSSSPDRAMQDQRQSIFMLHSTAHWQRTVHGYSGMQPPLHDALYAELMTFPDEDVLGSLASLGVTYVVVHGEMYAPADWTSVQAGLDRAADWLTLVYSDGPSRVYRIERPPLETLLRSRRSAFLAALQSGDPARAARFYADTAVVVLPKEPILRGRTDIEARLTKPGLSTAAGDRVEEMTFGRNEAYVTAGAQAKSGSLERRDTEVWRFQDGQWRLVYQVVTR